MEFFFFIFHQSNMGNVPGALSQDEINQLQESTNCKYFLVFSILQNNLLLENVYLFFLFFIFYFYSY